MVRKRGISPKLDLVFKKIFGDKKNSDILSFGFSFDGSRSKEY